MEDIEIKKINYFSKYYLLSGHLFHSSRIIHGHGQCAGRKKLKKY